MGIHPAAADTIVALASGRGKAGIAVVRASGPAAGARLAALAGPLPAPRVATLRRIRDPRSAETIDRGLVLWFPAPASFSGEDMAEFHVHGGPAVVAGVIEALCAAPGVRPAEPGEFTRRAFANGKLDLTAAEGLADLVAAETAAQRRQALRQLGGDLARLYDSWRERLVRALAHAEADIDFADEDLPKAVASAALRTAAGVAREIEAHLAEGNGERLREGISLAIVGPPNAGKSTLLNRLARREAAIVSPMPGTTRDVIEIDLDIGGYPVRLADTAGLRDAADAADAVEREGVRRARARAEDADLRLVVLDAETWPALDAHSRALIGPDAAVIVNKRDLRAASPPAEIGGCTVHWVSARTGEGLGELIGALTAEIARRWDSGAAPVPTRARHRAALGECRDALARAQTARLPELAAEDLRLAVRALGRLTGRVSVDDLLDVIFRDFCIGK